MSVPPSFHLEKAVATWRQFLAGRHVFARDDLDELERHLRDHTAFLVARGMDEELAFQRALVGLGDLESGEDEYAKVFWGKLRRQGRLGIEFKWRITMLKNYFRTALRIARRHPGYTAINVAGLSVGLACCIFIFLYIQDELSYDRYHEKADRIVRIAETLKTSSETLYQASSSPPMGPAFVADIPEVESMVRFLPTGALLSHGERRFQEDDLYLADSTVFDVFSFELLEGNPGTALTAPQSIVLTAATARKYFDDQDPLQRTLVDEDGDAYTVTGVMADVPRNSHFHFDALISFTTVEKRLGEGMNRAWFWNNYYTYLLLRPDADRALLKQHVDELIEKNGIGVTANEGTMGYAELPLIPLTDIHLEAHRSWELEPNGSRSNLYIFGAVALFVLMIACVNFMNLATARSARRAMEVGLRKVVGAQRSQLAGQFLSESFLMAIASGLLALCICWILMPVFNGLTDKALTLSPIFDRTSAPFVAGIVLLVGFIAGGYPALVLSSFRPGMILKGRFESSSHGGRLRKTLVVFQFAISIVLIVGTAIVMRQLAFVQQQNLGFNREQMLVVDFHGDAEVMRHREAIKQTLETDPGVVIAAFSSHVPGMEPTNWYTQVSGDGTEVAANLNYTSIDFDYLDTYGIDVVAGRGLSRSFPADTLKSLVINRAMLPHFGWQEPKEALGKVFRVGPYDRTVVGVVSDFNYRSLRETVQPMGMMIVPDYANYLTLRLKTDHLRETMAHVQLQWNELAPQRPFESFFVDDFFNRQYRSEERFAALFSYFAGLAILIACLGLFGLASFTAQQRTKEIGVRKVLGASVPGIVALLSREYLVLVTAAFAVAAPAAYFIMERWLRDFAYHTNVSLWIFVAAGLTALLIAVLTVSFQSIRAAVADPVKSLHYE